MVNDLLGYGFHHVGVGLQQIVPAHSRLSWETCGDHHDVASRCRRIVASRRGNARGARIRPRDRARFHHVQGFTCGRPVQNVGKHYVRQFHVHDPLRRGRSHKTASHYRHLFSAHAAPCRHLGFFTALPLRSLCLCASCCCLLLFLG